MLTESRSNEVEVGIKFESLSNLYIFSGIKFTHMSIFSPSFIVNRAPSNLNFSTCPARNGCKDFPTMPNIRLFEIAVLDKIFLAPDQNHITNSSS